MYKRNQRSLLKHADFTIFDLICVEISFLIVLVMRHDISVVTNIFSGGVGFNQYSRMLLFLLLIHFSIVTLTEPYSGILRRRPWEELVKVVTYNIYSFAGVVIILFAEKTSDTYSRIVLFTFPVINIVFMFVYRQMHKKQLKLRISAGDKQNYILLVAPYEQVKTVVETFRNQSISTVKLVGVVITDVHEHQEVAATLDAMLRTNVEEEVSTVALEGVGMAIHGVPLVGTSDTLYEYARTNVIDEVLICLDGERAEQIAASFIEMGITTHINIQSLIQMPKATMNEVNGIPVITSSVKTVTGSQLFVKRLIDIVLGLMGSIVAIILTILLAPIIWIVDPGPIFFRQERVGKNGRRFRIWKFRTMYKDAEARKAELLEQNKMSGHMFKLDDDPRIIGAGKKFSFGKFLRETSLDEFPQFFNILKGEMSVVGTRPPTVAEYKQYELHHKGRLATKPGLTGMWQVSGRSNITDFEEVVKLDKMYIDNFSLLLDFEIMLKTFKVVLGKKGSV